MELFEAIAKRHSYRGAYLSRRVPREDLQTIVQAGIQAPSGCNAQSTSFVIVDEGDVLEKLNGMLARAFPAMIVCVVDPAPVIRGMSFAVEDCAAAVENMLLAITALGYATVWLEGALRSGVGEKIGQLLGVPPGKRVEIVLPIGVPVEQGVQNTRKSFDERAWFNKYGG